MARWLVVWGGLSLLGAPAARAQWDDSFAKEQAASAERAVREAEAAVRLELAERVMAAHEQALGRALDPAYRQDAVKALADRPLGELLAIADGEAPVPQPQVGEAAADLVYTPVTPCRIIDTRLGGGAILGGSTRNFHVMGSTGFPAQGGTSGGCGIPLGPTTAAVINFVGVNPSGAGDFRAWAYGGTMPLASILNYASLPGLSIANAVVVPTCYPACTMDISVHADVSSAHLVADVVGYFRNVRKEQVAGFTVVSRSGATTTVGSTCTHYANAQVTVVAPVAGRIVVRADAWLRYTHINGNAERVMINIGANATDCAAGYGYTMVKTTPAAYPTTALLQGETTIPVMRDFAVAAGTHTFYLNGSANFAGAFQFYYSALQATFEPN